MRPLQPAASMPTPQPIAEETTNCPLTGYDADAITSCMPGLLRAAAAMSGMQKSEMEAFWTTCVTYATLQRLDESWLEVGLHPGETADDTEQTLADRAYGFLQEQAGIFFRPPGPEERSGGAGGSTSGQAPVVQCGPEAGLKLLLAEAKAVTEAWHNQYEQRVTSARFVEDHTNEYRAREQFEILSGNIVRAIMLRHDLVSCLTAPPVVSLTRVQRIVINITVIYLMFCVEIEIYARRGLDCCSQMRQKICPDSVDDVTLPCRGFSGDCNDLQATFTPLYGSNLVGFRCNTFPNPALFSDDIKSGLICAALGIPFQLVFEMFFEHYNERTVIEGWLTWRGVARLLRGPMDWRFTRGSTSPSRFTRMWARCSRTFMEIVTGTVDLLWKAVRRAQAASAPLLRLGTQLQ